MAKPLAAMLFNGSKCFEQSSYRTTQGTWIQNIKGLALKAFDKKIF